MSDFPKGGDVEATRAWLDKKGFHGLFHGWEADAILGKSDDYVKSKFISSPEEQEKAESFCGLLSTARQTQHPSATGLGGPASPGIFPSTSAFERFQYLLPNRVEDHILDTIAGNGWLASRASVIHTTEQAISLYNEVLQIQLSETRAEVLGTSNVAIGGIILIEGAQRATFHYAFEGCIPRVLKLPSTQTKVFRECALYDEIGVEAKALGLALVPVRTLQLRGTIRTNRFSPKKLVTHGILMPPYWRTLEDIPRTIVKKERVVSILNRIGPALDFIHQSGWLHGDIKPSNIFLDFEGNAWLGDYGSSIKTSDTLSYTGGTPKYQLVDVCVTEGGRFDRVGLALSLLHLLSFKYSEQLTIAQARILVDTITDQDIKSMLGALLE